MVRGTAGAHVGARLGAALIVFTSACGLDGVLFTPRGFDPSDPPRAIVTGTTRGGAEVSIVAR
ncbi:hypothetical protein L6R52_29540, partial [Myxococcota bacterium]|nr:hypothetical protein [Myxococcota bacterium]